MKRKNKQKTMGLGVVALAISLFYYMNSAKNTDSSKSVSINEWNKKVSKVKAKKPMSRSIASVKKNKVKLDPRVKVITTYKNAQKKKDRLISDKSKIKLPSGVVIKSDFKIDGLGYRFVDFKYAVIDNEENRKDYPNFKAKNQYLIVESDSVIYNSLPVVVNSETGNEGIFTGIIKVKLTDLRYIDNIMNHNNYTVTKTYDHIQVVHYKIDDVPLALETQNFIAKSPYVLRSKIEILEYSRTHR